MISNLGYTSGNRQWPPYLIFKNVCNDKNADVNLWITNTSQYQPAAGKWRKTGFMEKFQNANVNVRGGTGVDLKFQFRTQGRLQHSRPVNVKSFYLTIMDLDHGWEKGSKQVVEAADYVNYTLAEHSTVKVTDPTSSTYTVRFESTKKGKADNNPVGGFNLTEEQRKLGVSLYFEDVSTIHLKFAVEGKKLKSGRNFLFTGASEISHVQPEDEFQQGKLMQASPSAPSQQYSHQLGRGSGHTSATREHGRLKVEYAERGAVRERRTRLVRFHPRSSQDEATKGLKGILRNLWHGDV